MDISIKFYIKDGVKYILYFPEEWFPHIDNSGPIHCEQCKNTGMVNDIFVFYCSDCLLNVYNNKRGTSDYFNLIINEVNINEVNINEVNINEVNINEVNINEVNINEYIKLYYKLLIKNNIDCYGCFDLLTAEDIKKGCDDKDDKILCYECKNYPDFENWPPVGY
jgi:hypothetical protein